MKKIAAILFLLVLLFNLVGYQWVIDGILDRQERVLLTQLDQEAYQDEDLICIKTPINLPYYTNSAAYERIDGTIEINGIAYNYVKRRVYNDSLELLCLPNTAKQQLQTARADFIKLTHGYPASEGAKKVAGLIKNVLPEYCQAFTAFSFHAYALFTPSYSPFFAGTLSPACSSQQEQPPEKVLPFFRYT